jgi:hypothetical protein
MRIITFALLLAGLSACASGVTPASAPPSVGAAGSASSAGSDGAGAAEEAIEVVQVEHDEAVGNVADEPKLVCRRERRTGTNRAYQVCRTRAEIARTSREGKEVFDDLYESQMQNVPRE